MEIENLIKRLRHFGSELGATPLNNVIGQYMLDAATALSALQVENEEMQKQLNEFSEFLCHMTGGLLSKTNYTAQAMISAAEDYQQRVCDNDCGLRADLASVTAKRDAAIEDLEEIMFKGGHNIDTCHFCANGQCYGRGGTQVCNPLWRGIKED